MMRRVAFRLLVVAGIALEALVSVSLGRPGMPPVGVTPTVGSPKTAFRVSFRAAQRTGRFGSLTRHYVVRASGPTGVNGCVSAVSKNVPASPAHSQIRVKLTPGRGNWCSGAFHGQIEEVQGPACSKGKACHVSLLYKVGRFKFRAKPAPGDTAPPAFSGLKSAVACTPGPQRPGQTTPYTLTWDRATDDATPSTAIVYDVYESSSSGGEDFSKPSWTTPPGATSYKTPGLPSHGPAFFVVRARDQAGNEDQNRVERRGIDACV